MSGHLGQSVNSNRSRAPRRSLTRQAEAATPNERDRAALDVHARFEPRQVSAADMVAELPQISGCRSDSDPRTLHPATARAADTASEGPITALN